MREAVETSPERARASAPVPAGTGWYDASLGVPLAAVAGYMFENRDSVFSYWDVDGVNQVQGVNPITITLNAAHTATAHYKMIPVGGEWVPINAVQMLVQLVGSVVAMSAIVASFISFKRIKKNKTNDRPPTFFFFYRFGAIAFVLEQNRAHLFFWTKSKLGTRCFRNQGHKKAVSSPPIASLYV